MNFLAHLWLADQTQTSLAGAVVADFVRGTLTHWPEPLRTGMVLHRFIDKTVDESTRIFDLKAQFKPEHRRVAGICLDMAFDYQLAKNWVNYHSTPLSLFSQNCYHIILNTPNLPANAFATLENMARYDWLFHYQFAQTIEHALKRIALRLSKPERLLAASDEIWRLEAQIATEFELLLQELKLQANEFLAKK